MTPRPPVLSKGTAEEFVAMAEVAELAARSEGEFLDWLERHDRACARAFAEVVDREILEP